MMHLDLWAQSARPNRTYYTSCKPCKPPHIHWQSPDHFWLLQVSQTKTGLACLRTLHYVSASCGSVLLFQKQCCHLLFRVSQQESLESKCSQNQVQSRVKQGFNTIRRCSTYFPKVAASAKAAFQAGLHVDQASLIKKHWIQGYVMSAQRFATLFQTVRVCRIMEIDEPIDTSRKGA